MLCAGLLELLALGFAVESRDSLEFCARRRQQNPVRKRTLPPARVAASCSSSAFPALAQRGCPGAMSGSPATPRETLLCPARIVLSQQERNVRLPCQVRGSNSSAGFLNVQCSLSAPRAGSGARSRGVNQGAAGRYTGTNCSEKLQVPQALAETRKTANG